jgi:hypothetical protein
MNKLQLTITCADNQLEELMEVIKMFQEGLMVDGIQSEIKTVTDGQN